MLNPWPPMTPAEKDKVTEITNWKQPTCPGCGATMTLGLEDFKTPPKWMREKYRYAGWYYCRRCDCWRTTSAYGYSANQAAENAYKKAMRRTK